MPDFATQQLVGQLTYSYLIRKQGSNYIAYNTLTDIDEFVFTEAGALFNAVINAMNAAGGGVAFVKNGVYICTTTVTLKDNAGLVGESKYKTILRNNQTTSQLLKYAAGAANFLANFILKDIKFESGNVNGNGTGASDTHWYTSGAINVVFENCCFQTYAAPSGPAIQVFFDTFSNVNDNTNIQVHNCEFTGPAAGEDYFGCGRMVACDWSYNYVHDVTAQGIGVGASRKSLYNHNRFVNVGTNAIGMENDCQDNEYCNNTLWNTGGLKMSQEGATATHISRNNKCTGNHISYGLGGVEAGISIGDHITGNTFYRCERNGVRGSFSGCRIANNFFVDGNWGFYTQVIPSGGSGQKVGGIVCLNNTTPLPTNDYNSIENNTFLNTNVQFTDPVSSSTNEEGDMCGVILDTNYRYTALNNNNGHNLDVDTVIDFSTNKLTNGGWYANPEDNVFVMNERILKLKGSDNLPITWLESTGQNAPNQSFDFVAQYTKQASATNVPATFGYNSDIYSWEWWSKASGSNKRYFSIDAINDSVNLDGNIKTADNQITFTKMTAPSAPGADDIALYVDTADTRPKVKNSANKAFDLMQVNPVERLKKWIVFETDFIHPQEAINLIPYDDSVSGTNAAVANAASTSATEQGIITLTTGTTATGRASIGPSSTNFNTVMLGGGEITYIIKLKITDLSTSAQRYILRFGLMDSLSAESSNGVYFIYDEANSVNWRIMARAGGSGSAVSSGTVVNTNWNILKIVINAAGNSASFYINGALLATNNTISSGLPTGAMAPSIVSHIKSVGNTARVITLDFIGFYMELTTARVF